MKKITLTLALCGAMLGMNSCQDGTLGQVQEQVSDIISVETTTALLVGADLNKNPKHLQSYKKAITVLSLLAARGKLTLGEVRDILHAEIDKELVLGRQEIKNALDKASDKISTDPEYNLIENRDALLQVISGIKIAINRYEEKTVSVQK